jgi:hypothetical protein
MLVSSRESKIPITAIVVGLNERPLLSACFESVGFCQDIIYLDLGSTDASVDLAVGQGVAVQRAARHDAVEAVVSENIHMAKHRWVLLIDPDERISSELAIALGNLSLTELEENGFASISVPWRFYFKSRRLLGTPWGGLNSKSIVFDTKRCRFVSEVHKGKVLESGTRDFPIPATGSVFLEHLWIRSWREGIQKHLRYAALEREKLTTSWTLLLPLALFVEWSKRFVESFVLCRGYRDLQVGFFLSLLWATYHMLIKTPKRKRR